MSRKHRCYCSVVNPDICPFHAGLAYSKFLSGDGEAPLFPGEDGAALAKEKTIAVIRRTLANNKVSLKRPGPKGVGVVERFHGHCLRVSGAQLMCRLRVPVSTIMLLGRWGSRSIERYVQDAELEVFDIAEAAENSARQAQTEPVSLQKLQHVQAQHAQQHVDTTGLVERLDNLAAQVETLQQRPPFIVGRKVHKRDDDEATRLPILWQTRCGCWKYGRSRFIRVRQPGDELCRRCFVQEADGQAESESLSESSGSKTDSDSSGSGTSSGSCDESG